MMPPELKEISGLALKPDGMLLTHDDTFARIFVIDPRTGIVTKRFSFGDGLKGDFEGITIAGDDIYVIESKGKIYQFKEGANGATVPHTVLDTNLGKECEFEGIVYEPDSAWLVMPCKEPAGKKADDKLHVYRWRLDGPGLYPTDEGGIPALASHCGTRLAGFPDLRHHDRSGDT
jgi:hypothetical protein